MGRQEGHGRHFRLSKCQKTTKELKGFCTYALLLIPKMMDQGGITPKHTAGKKQATRGVALDAGPSSTVLYPQWAVRI
jgi:hypothetical protein